MTHYSLNSFHEPMDYLRSLLHVSHSAIEQPIPRKTPDTTRGSCCTDSIHLSPPLAAYDDTESPPFLPQQSDRTSLNQMGKETQTPATLLSTLSRRHSGYSSPERATVRAHSHPSSPLVESSSFSHEFLRRRSSVPASVLRRNDKRHNTPQESSPSVRFDLDHESLDCPEGISAGGPSFTGNPEVVPDLYHNLEDFDPELEPDDQFRSQAQFEASSSRSQAKHPDEARFDEDMNSTTPPELNRADTDPGSDIPSGIRLVQPSTIRRRSLPSSLWGTKPLVVSLHESMSDTKSGVEIFPPKSRCVSVATTHANVHSCILGKMAGNQNLRNDDSQRKLSATRQVVRSNDSAYEVIWEDVRQPLDVTTKASATYSTSSSISPDSSKPLTPRDVDEPELSNLEQVNTKLTAWSWARGNEPFDPPKCAQALRTTRSDDIHLATHTSPCISYGAKQDEPVTTSLPSSDVNDEGPSCQSITTERDEARSLEDSNLQDRESIDHDTTAIQPRLDPSHNEGAKVTQRLPKSNAQKRRELMGKRKITNILPEDECFASHRDSLMLARMRIFHDDVELGPHHFKAINPLSVDSEVEQLKRSTWS